MKKKLTWILILSLAAFGPLVAGCQGTKARLKKAENHYEYGLLYLRNGKYNLAANEFQKAQKLNKRDARLYNGLGLTYYFQGKFYLATQTYRKAIELNQEYPEAYNNMAAALAKEEKWPEVIRYADKALAISSYLTPELAHFNKGVAYYHLKKYEKALTEFETSQELDSNYADTYYQMGLTLSELKRYSQASKSFQKALELLSMSEGGKKDPLFIETSSQLAIAYFRNKQMDLAAKEFQKIISLAPQSTQAKEAQKYLNTLKMK